MERGNLGKTPQAHSTPACGLRSLAALSISGSRPWTLLTDPSAGLMAGQSPRLRLRVQAEAAADQGADVVRKPLSHRNFAGSCTEPTGVEQALREPITGRLIGEPFGQRMRPHALFSGGGQTATECAFFVVRR